MCDSDPIFVDIFTFLLYAGDVNYAEPAGAQTDCVRCVELLLSDCLNTEMYKNSHFRCSAGQNGTQSAATGTAHVRLVLKIIADCLCLLRVTKLVALLHPHSLLCNAPVSYTHLDEYKRQD